MESNNLYAIGLSDYPDNIILEEFLKAKISEDHSIQAPYFSTSFHKSDSRPFFQ